MPNIENKLLADLWLEKYGHQPIHERHTRSAGFANWVGLHLGIIKQIVLPEHTHDKLVIVDGLPGSNSPKIAEAVRMLRLTHKYDKPIHLHGMDSDLSVINDLNELLSGWRDVFTFFPYHAFLTAQGVVSLQEKPSADATIINHGIDDLALYELSKEKTVVFEPDKFPKQHAEDIVHLLTDSKPQDVADAQERAAVSMMIGVRELTKQGGLVVLTHYNTINWTRYEKFEQDYFPLISAFAMGAFGLVKQMANINHEFNVQPTKVDQFVLYDSKRQDIEPGENIFDEKNLLVIRKD
jgi:hypothetical protein